MLFHIYHVLSEKLENPAYQIDVEFQKMGKSSTNISIFVTENMKFQQGNFVKKLFEL